VAHTSSAELLVMHGLRLKGLADAAAIAQRFAPGELVDELLDYEAFPPRDRRDIHALGWQQHHLRPPHLTTEPKLRRTNRSSRLPSSLLDSCTRIRWAIAAPGGRQDLTPANFEPHPTNPASAARRVT
jgi:hypothetical protein